jgi:hypothetical protein
MFLPSLAYNVLLPNQLTLSHSDCTLAWLSRERNTQLLDIYSIRECTTEISWYGTYLFLLTIVTIAVVGAVGAKFAGLARL